MHELLDRVVKDSPSRAAVADNENIDDRVVVLEVGSGLGITACEFVKRWKSCNRKVPLSYYGFDFVKEAVEISRKNALLHHLNVNMESLDCLDDSLDDDRLTKLDFFQHNWHNNLLDSDHGIKSSLNVMKNVDLLIASDVLYMRNSLGPLARLVRQCLGRPSSVAMFIDPGRGNEQEFIDLFDGDVIVELVVLTRKELVESGLLSIADDARDDDDDPVEMKRKEQQHETLQKINIIMISCTVLVDSTSASVVVEDSTSSSVVVEDSTSSSVVVESIVDRLRVALLS